MKFKRNSHKFPEGITFIRLLFTLKQDSILSTTYFRQAVIISAAILSFAGNIDGDFVFDDREAILKNKAIREFGKILESDFWGHPIRSRYSHKSYRPITTFTFALNYAFSGLHSTTYHIVNIILHAVVCLMVYKLVLNFSSIFDFRYSYNTAFYASLLFAVHPIHSEAVASIVGRAELLMALFTLAALYLYLKSWSKSRFSIGSVAAILILSISAMFSKEQGIVVMPLCVLFDVMASKFSLLYFVTALKKWMEDRKNHNVTDTRRKSFLISYYACIRRLALCSFVCLTLLLVRFSIIGFQLPQFSSKDNSIAFNPFILLRMINYCYIYMLNIWLQLYPFQLCFDYSMGCIPLIESVTDQRLVVVTIFIIAVILIAAQLIRGFNEQYKIETFCILFYAISFIPASNIFVTVGFVVAERILYLPSVAFCILFARLFGKLEQIMTSKNIGYIPNSSISIIVILLLIKSYKRSKEWRNELDLYESGLLVCPFNAKIHYNIAKIMAENGDTDRATTNYINAIRLNPNYEQALNNLANIYLKNNRSKEAERLLRKTVQVSPNFAAGWMNLGIALMARKRYKDAENSFRKALSLRLPYPDCLYNMGLLYLQQNKKTYARRFWQSVIREKPSHKEAWLNLLILLDEMGHCEEASSMANKVLTYHPTEAPILAQLGICYGRLGQYDDAEQSLLAAIQLDRNNAAYWNNIGTVYQLWGKYEKGEFAFRKVLQLHPQLGRSQQYISKLKRKESLI